jgi:hypothetical protein
LTVITVLWPVLAPLLAVLLPIIPRRQLVWPAGVATKSVVE